MGILYLGASHTVNQCAEEVELQGWATPPKHIWGHFKALGDMHECSDFLKNIYSVVNDEQNASELVVVQSMIGKRFSLSWDNDRTMK